MTKTVLKVSSFGNVFLVSSFGPKMQQKYCKDFCPEIFCPFLGLSGSFLGLPEDLVSNIINKEAYREPKKASRQGLR